MPRDTARPLAAIEAAVRTAYKRWVRPRLRTVLAQQRLKLVWDAWEYVGLFAIANVPLRQRLALVAKMLRIDWNVPHAHKPRELLAVFRAIAERPANTGEAVIEAGCWLGGSTAKLSLVCKAFRYELHVYDSFEGVEARTELEGDGNDFSGNYAARLEVVRAHVEQYGEASVCRFHPGWFADTLASPPSFTVRGVYIDCDLAKGTKEVLYGVVSALAPDAWIFSQDAHIDAVRELLASNTTWEDLGLAWGRLDHVYRNLGRVVLGDRLPSST